MKGINRRYGILFTLIIAAAIVTAGAYLYMESGKYSSPEATLRTFCDAINSYDLGEVRACLDDDLMKLFFYSHYPQDSVKNIIPILRDFQLKVEGLEKVRTRYEMVPFGDALVSTEITLSATDLATGERSTITIGESIPMVKRNGEWKTWFFIKDPINTGFEWIRDSIDESLHMPNTPQAPSGPTSGLVGESYSYSTSATDPGGDQVRYYFDWDDNTGDWTEWVDSGASASASHSWSSPDIYYVSVQAEGILGGKSGWSFVGVEIVENVG